MKKAKTLKLSRETLTLLQDEQVKEIHGGVVSAANTEGHFASCPSAA